MYKFIILAQVCIFVLIVQVDICIKWILFFKGT